MMMLEETLLLPLAGGGLLGFAVGYAVKKLFKFALIGVGVLILLLGYLEYNKWITANWTVIENQTQVIAGHMLATADKVTQHLGHVLSVGLIGFIPGLALGFLKG